MTDYSLTLQIDPVDLRNIKKAGEMITLAKPIGGDSPSVVWLSIDPFEATTVEWTEEYWIYASDTEILEGEKVFKISEVSRGPAQDGGSYSFSKTSTFETFQKDTQIPLGTYSAINAMPYDKHAALTFGLAQSALVNKKPVDRKPISAQSVLAQQQIKMTPFTTVFVWLQSQFESETIITTITGNAVAAKFGGGANDLTLKYDPAKGVFISA